MKYDFDEIIDRENTSSVKYDLREKIFNRSDVIPLWVADMDFRTPDFIIEALRARLDHEILGYSFRSDAYFQSIVNWFHRRHNFSIDKEWISFSPGIVPALNLAVMAFTDPGDGIIVQPPVYFPFFSAVKNHNRKLLYNELILRGGRYHIDFTDLAQKAKKAKMLIISNPHNPGGSVWTKSELQQISVICLENKVLVMADEIHCDLLLNGNRYVPFASISKEASMNSLTFIAASKTFNLAGLASASIFTENDGLKRKFDEVVENIHIGNGNIFGNIATMTAYQKGDEWLNQLLNYIAGNLDFVTSYLETNIPQIKVIKPEGTYLVWLDFRQYNMNADELEKLLINEAAVGMNKGTMFGPGGEGFMRMNIACPRITLETALEQMKKALH